MQPINVLTNNGLDHEALKKLFMDPKVENKKVLFRSLTLNLLRHAQSILGHDYGDLRRV